MSEKKLVLCIDDDEDILNSLVALLSSRDFRVERATSGAEALEKFERARPDFVICDLMMESADTGLTLVRKMRSARAEIPIFLLSSVGAGLEQHADARQLGISAVFQKPLDPAAILQALGAGASGEKGGRHG